MRDRNLHEALEGFPLAQTGGELTFLDRLCRENNWPYDFGHRAIGEYKRFVYLAMVSPMPVTPSDEVDQVWHLHLLYTRSYWEEMTKLLPRPLHHGPTSGGQEEDEKFGGWYERTKALYESEFGEEAPPDLWPPPAVRFSPGQRFRRLDAARHWIVPKPAWRIRQGAAAFAALPLVFPLLAAGMAGSTILVMILLAWFVMVTMVAAMNSPGNKRKKDGSDGGGSCGGGGSSSSSGDCGDGGGSGDCGGSGCGGGGCGGGCGGGD